MEKEKFTYGRNIPAGNFDEIADGLINSMPEIAPYARKKSPNKPAIKLRKVKASNRDKNYELLKLKDWEKEFFKLDFLNPNKNKTLINDTERMSGMLHLSLIHIINYIKENGNYDATWIKQLLSAYKESVGDKSTYTFYEKEFFAHFIGIMTLNKITPRQGMLLLRHFFDLSESEAKRINNIYQKNKSEYPNPWSSRHLAQMWILYSIIGTGNSYSLNYRGIKEDTKIKFKTMIIDTLDFFKEKLKDKKFKKDHLDFFNKNNELVIHYINQEYPEPLNFIANLTDNHRITEIHKNIAARLQEIKKCESELRIKLYRGNYGIDNLDIKVADAEIVKIQNSREEKIKFYDLYYKSNCGHLQKYKDFEYQLIELMGRIDQNISPNRY